MELARSEIMPGVFLSHLQSDKFKTAFMSVSLLTQLKRDTASLNALVPFVLRRGTARYPDLEQLTGRMEELYGTSIEPVVRKVGEIHCIGFAGSFPEGEYLPGNEPILSEATALMGQMLLNPVTRGGLLLPAYVDSEKEKLCDIIRSRINDKRGYAVSRCIEEMCCYEDYAVFRYGSEEDMESVNYKKLTRHYKTLLQTCPVELFYCGKADEMSVISAMREAFAALPRAEIDYDIGTDLRMNAVEDQVRYVEEEMEVSQGKLVIGFRMGECMEEPDLAALNVFSCIYGSGTTSKLFMNVREKLSLCYYASSAVLRHKGLMLVQSGIDCDKYEQARDEIFRQLELVKQGEITEEELNSARKTVSSDLRGISDSQGELESFFLSQSLCGLDWTPDELADAASQVTKEDVVAIANSVECDLIYFLKGTGEEEEDAEE